MRSRMLVAVLMVLGSGCKSEPAAVDSGLPASTPAAELEPDERATLCEALADTIIARLDGGQMERWMCTIEAFGDAAESSSVTSEQIAACVDLRDACIAAGEHETFTVNCDGAQDWSTCDLTVGEIETCYTDMVNLLDRVSADFTCDILDPARAMALQEKYGAEAMGLPASCAAVEERCPEALGGREDDAEAGT